MSATPAAIGSGRVWLRRSLGGPAEQLKTARRVALASGAVVILCATVLIGDYAVGAWRGAGQTARIVELEEQTGTDAEVAARLHEERKQQTDESLARETRGRVLAWVLLVAGGVFVAAGRWWMSLGRSRCPRWRSWWRCGLGCRRGRRERGRGGGAG